MSELDIINVPESGLNPGIPPDSKGLIRKFQKNVEIENLKNIKLNADEFLFHAGTSKKKIQKCTQLVEEF